MSTSKETENDLIKRTILINRYHKEYLDNHPDINLSGYVRMKLDQDIEKEGE